jgi:hypothetical protein
VTIKRTQNRNIMSVRPPSRDPAAFPPTAPSTEYTSSSRWTSAKTDIVRPAGTDASQNAVNHLAARALLGVLPVEQKIIDTMPAFLIGQESNRDAFQFLVKELLSPTRLHAPAMVLTGTRGHGQDQALEGLSHAVGQNGVVVTVDAAQLNSPGEFAAALKEAPTGSIVRIVHVAGLATSKPAIAADIARYISQPKGDKTSNYYVLDVEVPSTEDARTAAGAVFNSLVVSTAAFAPLSPTAMEQYCRLRVEHLLQQQGMGHVAVGFGDGVLPLLGELLATTHAPLHDIDTRLNQWLLSAFSTATDVTRDGGIVTVRLTDAGQDKNVVKDVTEQVRREVAQYDAATPLFSVHETGVFADTKDNNVEEVGYTTMAALLQLEMQHGDVQTLMKSNPIVGRRVHTLLTACQAMTAHAQQQTRHGLGTVDASGAKLSVVDDKKLQAWSDAYGAVQALNQPVLQAAFDRAEEKTSAVVDRAEQEAEASARVDAAKPRSAKKAGRLSNIDVPPDEDVNLLYFGGFDSIILSEVSDKMKNGVQCYDHIFRIQAVHCHQGVLGLDGGSGITLDPNVLKAAHPDDRIPFLRLLVRAYEYQVGPDCLSWHANYPIKGFDAETLNKVSWPDTLEAAAVLRRACLIANIDEKEVLFGNR